MPPRPEFSLKTVPPDSVLPYPDGLASRLKYFFWRAISYPFPYVRDWLLTAGFIRHSGRQAFLLGRLKSPADIGPFLRHLSAQGFGNHFIAWKDDGQLVSLRRLDGFERQYHLRIFKDGEVRGHYEFTPESHPWWHQHDVGVDSRREDFLRFLGDWIESAR